MKRNGTTSERPKPLPWDWKREYDWAFAHYHELSKRYPNQWVAFANHHVLAGGPRLDRVMTKAHEQIDWPEIPHLFVESGIHLYAHRP
jgi:hypothetical protein